VLKFGKDREYYSSRRGGGWNWARGGGGRGGFFPGAPNVMRDLAQAMITNPKLLVLVENGIYDMATPFYPTEFTMTHLGLPAALQQNITLTYYDSGHMMYLRDEDRVQQRKNIVAFIDKAVKQ
jgi:carboxypeptidase C (cathepsin A)